MKTMMIIMWCYVLLAIGACIGSIARDDHHRNEPDLLPSWNEGPLKQSIIDFIKKVADSTSKVFIPAIDRIATFDNDGPLWAYERKPVFQIEKLEQY